jgi:predicted TPR repeat methyltransferase
VSWFAIVLLVAAVVLLAAAEWTRFAKLGEVRGERKRARRKSRLRVVENDPDDDFAASVERDLAALPTIDEHEPRR